MDHLRKHFPVNLADLNRTKATKRNNSNTLLDRRKAVIQESGVQGSEDITKSAFEMPVEVKVLNSVIIFFR